jgi:hypothetical protein
MKDLTLIVWLTQFGLNVALPPVCFVLLAIWLRDYFGWGGWVLWVGIALGVYSAIEGLISSVKLLQRLGKKKKDPDPPAVSFNDHE